MKMDYYYNVGDNIIDDSRELRIIEREIRSTVKDDSVMNRKWYKYRCIKCGNENWISEYRLKRKAGCNACCASPQKVVRGINDIATTDAWMISYIKNKEDAYKYNKSSGKCIDFVCPYCGKIYNKPIQYVFRKKHLSCICSDGISFPNKFMYAILQQLGVEFEIEKSFDWSDGRIYDDYIKYNNLKIIVEQHGKQHYDKPIIKSKNRYRTVDEEKQNDIHKKELALSNGIDYYFEIDSRESTKEYIKNSICSSGLLDLLCVDPTCIDWNKCLEFATSNLAKEVCNYKLNNPNTKLKDIAIKFKLDKSTIYNYIKAGNELGWCSYQFNSDRKLPNRKNQKPIYCVSNDTYYDCSKTVAEALFINQDLIKRAANHGTAYRGFKFKYITQSEFNNIKTNSPNKVVGELFIINN